MMYSEQKTHSARTHAHHMYSKWFWSTQCRQLNFQKITYSKIAESFDEGSKYDWYVNAVMRHKIEIEIQLITNWIV